jgi:hypothetical protein
MSINGITIWVPVSRAWQRQAAYLVETVVTRAQKEATSRKRETADTREGERETEREREREKKSERESRVFSAASLIIYRISQRCHVLARARARPTHIRVSFQRARTMYLYTLRGLPGIERARERERERERKSARVFLVAEAKTRVHHVAYARRQDHFRPAFAPRSSASPVSMGSAPANGSRHGERGKRGCRERGRRGPRD